MTGLFGDDETLPPPPSGPGLFGDEPAAAVPQAVAYRVLARKYRPKDFDDLIGQDALVRTLRNSFAQGRVAHAFMLTGVRGVGKTTTARILARAMNCIGVDGNGGPTADPCGVCANCVAILADRHPDVIEIDAASNTGVDYVREIIEATRFKPMQARTKLFIIDEVHMLSKQAFNALLKTLEEPPAHIKFVFATTEIRKVPITVLSRCQRFDLKRVSMSELAAHFARIAAKENVAISEGALEMIARASDGSVRDGLSLLDQAIARESDGEIGSALVADMLGLADRTMVFDLLEAVMAGKPEVALDITDRAYAAGADLGVLLGDMLDLIHTLTRIKAVPALKRGQELPETERVRGAVIADQLSVPVLARTWQMLLKGLAEVEAAPDRRAAAEMVLIRLCHVADLPPPGDLVKQLLSTGPQSTGTPGPGPSGGGVRAMAGGGAMMQAAPRVQDAPQPGNFRELAAMVAESREAMLHAHLVHSVHLVRFAPPVLELRVEADTPRDFAPKLGTLLLDITRQRWTIALSTAPGEPTLAEQGNSADHARREQAGTHPLVRAILDAFPGAKIQAVLDDKIDAYGLSAEPALGEPDMPEFAPPDAEFASPLED
jgi:DNA polymerase-3 subunit gamma/tau